MQRLSRHITGFIRGKKGDCGGDVLDRTGATRRNLGEYALALLVVELVGHRRDDKSGRDAIGGDAALGVFRAIALIIR